MARRPRLQLPGWPVHAVVRGNNRQAIFVTQGDRVHFHRCAVEVARERGVAVHAYVFMDNHVHFLATPGKEGAIGRFFQSLGRRYVGYFNHLHGRTGTLWEGRYRASPIARDEYVLAVYRYIEMNPLRAAMVTVPAAFAWSSHRANIGLQADDLVVPHPTFLALARKTARRPIAYLGLFEKPLEVTTIDHLRDCLHHGWTFGDEAGRKALSELSGKPTERRRPGRKAAGNGV